MREDLLKYLTPAQREAWARHEAATKGPWMLMVAESGSTAVLMPADVAYSMHSYYTAPADNPVRTDEQYYEVQRQRYHNAKFAQEARTDLPESLEALAVARKALEVLAVFAEKQMANTGGNCPVSPPMCRGPISVDCPYCLTRWALAQAACGGDEADGGKEGEG